MGSRSCPTPRPGRSSRPGRGAAEPGQSSVSAPVSWTGCGQDSKRGPIGTKLVDKAVVAPAVRPVWFVLPEGAAELKTEPTVLASTETGSGRKFLRAFCCLARKWALHRPGVQGGMTTPEWRARGRRRRGARPAAGGGAVPARWPCDRCGRSPRAGTTPCGWSTSRSAFRFPRRAIAMPGVEREIRVLPGLARELPLPIPTPTFIGRPSAAYRGRSSGRRCCRVASRRSLRSTGGGARSARRWGRSCARCTIPGVLCAARGRPPGRPDGARGHGGRVPKTREALGELAAARGVDPATVGRAHARCGARPLGPADGVAVAPRRPARAPPAGRRRTAFRVRGHRLGRRLHRRPVDRPVAVLEPARSRRAGRRSARRTGRRRSPRRGSCGPRAGAVAQRAPGALRAGRRRRRAAGRDGRRPGANRHRRLPGLGGAPRTPDLRYLRSGGADTAGPAVGNRRIGRSWMRRALAPG